jgi:hypothetical protein
MSNHIAITSLEITAEAFSDIDHIDAGGDKVRLAYTATVMGRTVTHKDATPVVPTEARAALNVLVDLGAVFASISVYRHEGLLD